jgi:predicted nucleotidyltransferase
LIFSLFDNANPMNHTHSISGMKQVFEALLVALREACMKVYGDRLVSLCVFGSVAAGVMKRDSDIDILLVCERLPQGRMARVREFEAVDTLCKGTLDHDV